MVQMRGTVPAPCMPLPAGRHSGGGEWKRTGPGGGAKRLSAIDTVTGQTMQSYGSGPGPAGVVVVTAHRIGPPAKMTAARDEVRCGACLTHRN